jgi:hypothetical protein
MMSWSTDPDVVATTVFDPATQADYRLEGTLAGGEMAPMAEAEETAEMAEAEEEPAAEMAEEAPAAEAAEAPATLPVSGGVPFDFTWIYLVAGSGLLGAGLYLRRR